MSDFRKINIRVAWMSIILNILIFGMKYYSGYSSNSIAMIADAWHSLSDSFTSFIVIFGIWLAHKPADEEHPYGHGRAETIAALMVSLILGIVGFEFILQSFDRFNSPEIIEYSTMSLIVFGITILMKEIMAQISIFYGKKSDSDSLKADGWHHRSDAITTVLIIIGALIGPGLKWLDPALAIVVALFIFWTAYSILRDSVDVLLGRGASKKFAGELSNIIEDMDPAIYEVHSISMHSYGKHHEAIVHMRLPKDMTVVEAHDVASKIEKEIYDLKGIRVTAHIEPCMHKKNHEHN